MVEYDWLSGTPLSHLSFVLRHLIPLRHVPPVPVPDHPVLKMPTATKHLIPQDLRQMVARMNQDNNSDDDLTSECQEDGLMKLLLQKNQTHLLEDSELSELHKSLELHKMPKQEKTPRLDLTETGENSHQPSSKSTDETDESNSWRAEEIIGMMWQRTLMFFNNDQPIVEYPSGSKWEGLNLPPFFPLRTLQTLKSRLDITSADIDIISVIDQKRVGYEDETDTEQLYYVIQTEGCHPGYLQLTMTPQAMRSLLDDNGDDFIDRDADYLLSAKALTQQLQELLNEIIAGPRLSSASVISKGPSLKIEVDLTKDTQSLVDQILEIDQVLAFPCVSWPREAKAWVTRSRRSGWPSSSLIGEITADGCLVVPVRYEDSPDEETKWRFSFSWAESKLALSLSDTQRQTYLLFKCLLQHSLSLPKVLKSYHLKNILFWACEDIPAIQWTRDNLATTYLCLIDRLLHCLAGRRLPHYFIPENNLFDTVPDDFITDIMAKVSNVRHNPIRHVFDFQRHYSFLFDSCILTREVIYDPLVKNLEVPAHENDVMKVQEAQFVSLLQMVKIHLGNHKKEAFSILKDECDLLKFSLLFDDRAMERLGSLAKTVEPDYGIKLYEYLVDLCDGVTAKAMVLSNLACFCHAASNNDKTTRDQQEAMRSKAEETFQQTMRSLPLSTALCVEYANFLCRTRQWSMATEVLEEVTQKEEVNPNERNSYSRHDACTLDENIRAEVISEGKFEVLSAIYAYYLLVTCYLATRNKAAAEKRTEHMFAMCFIMPSARGYSLLGYAFLMLGNFTEAACAFEHAIRLNPDYKYAQKNLTVCHVKSGCTST
ncbi:hypothetical protein NP493_133g01012 [Ridgeia piscesae]|uniref:Mab-21-like HhH/H2TH-like domain-containing protein n=1 Tax=Ridgeia piscesae TaxID=27915 RepID=A0AAD9UGE5_RIDPI|nr:hypothetical protein NP493_133g01012 [Ridgeia piscesae]